MISSKKTKIFLLCCKCTVQATNAWWFGDVHVSVEKCRRPEYSYAKVKWNINKTNLKTHLQDFINALTARFKGGLYIARDSPWAGKRCSRPPSFHKYNEVIVLDNFMWAVVFGTPSRNMSSWVSSLVTAKTTKKKTHLASSAVWARWDTLTGCWPWQANAANIDPSRPSDFLFSKAESTRSWPKHLTAWLLRLDMAARSFESR